MAEEAVSWEKTIEMLQPLIKAPKLSEKLLRKPPFRFLHDIVTNFSKSTGYFVGLFSEDEIDSAKVTEKEAKIAFLQKIILAVEVTLSAKLAIKPVKVISGLEAEATNQFLQAMAETVLKKLDWKKPLEKAMKGETSGGGSGGAGAEKEKKEKEKEKKPEKEKEKEDKSKEKHSRGDLKDMKEEGKSSDRDKEKEKEKEKRDERHRDKKKEGEGEKREERKDDDRRKDKEKTEPSHKKSKDEERRSGQGSTPSTSAASSSPPSTVVASSSKDAPVEPKQGDVKQERPLTAAARKGPPITKSNVIQSDTSASSKSQAVQPPTTAVTGLIVESKKKSDNKSKDSDSEDEIPTFETAAVESKAEVGYAEGGGYLSKMAIDAKQKASPTEDFSRQSAAVDVTAGTGIILHRTIGGNKKEKESFQQEINKLRESLQTLTKTTNPLGKAMDYIQEDLDSMQRELDMWIMEASQQQSSWTEQQRVTEETLQPLFAQLNDLDDSINDQILKIHSSKAGILRHDQTIETLLKMVVSGGYRS